MKTVTKYETFDGALHGSWDVAKRHVEAKYADMLSKLTHKMLSECNGKYAATGDFIDANLDVFLGLAAIKKDLILSNPEDSEEE